MKSNKWIGLMIAGILLATLLEGGSQKQQSALAATVIHVKPNGSVDSNCGNTWTNACELQTAISLASVGDEIWVTAGTFKPGANREDTFSLKNDVSLYGGFNGMEDAIEQRDWQSNLTILSGDIGIQDDVSDNSYHVITSTDADFSTIFDGFTIIGGNANVDENFTYTGGGMLNFSSSPSLTNLTFRDNYALIGGGMYNDVGSSPILTNVIFSDNQAETDGGGMLNNYSQPVLVQVSFSANTANSGGGMYNFYSNPTLTNVYFSNNVADHSGGGLYNGWYSDPTLTGVSFIGNSSGLGGGGGMYNWTSSPRLMNVIFSNNSGDSGGGVYNQESSPILYYVAFSENSADSAGGGMANYGGNPVLTNVTFTGNQANYGGGIDNGSGATDIINAIFSGNTAGSSGGGIYNGSNTLKLTNVTFSGNTASLSGGGIYNGLSIPTLTNSIVWNNSPDQIAGYNNATATFSDVQGGYPGLGNIDLDPLFLDVTIGNLHLPPYSPAIDAGNNAAVPAEITIDLDGHPRFLDIPGVADIGVGPGPVVDMGAYENQAYIQLCLPLMFQ